MRELGVGRMTKQQGSVSFAVLVVIVCLFVVCFGLFQLFSRQGFSV